jgi:hypothetical protein
LVIISSVTDPCHGSRHGSLGWTRLIRRCFRDAGDTYQVESPEEIRSQWEEIALFMIAMLSLMHRRDPQKNPDVTHLFRFLTGAYMGSGLLLYVALAEGAEVDEEMEAFVIENLVAGATRMGEMVECESYNQELESKGRSPIELLAKLHSRPAALKGLLTIKTNPSVSAWMRARAELALERIAALTGSEFIKPAIRRAV